MVIENKLTESNNQFEKINNYFINLGNGEELSEAQCNYMKTLDYYDFSKLLGSLIIYNTKISKLAFDFYDNNILKPKIDKYNLESLKYANYYTKDAIELMLGVTEEPKRKDLLLVLGEINENINYNRYFNEAMISLLSIAFAKISTLKFCDLEDDEIENIIEKVIDDCIKLKLINESPKFKNDFKFEMSLIVNRFKKNIMNNDCQNIELFNYIDGLLENDYKDQEEFNHTSYVMQLYERKLR